MKDKKIDEIIIELLEIQSKLIDKRKLYYFALLGK